ncbi:MAG: hypothetical protein DMF72_06235 [Acidobacteria bacterium]|nr:MAG: hypothetical protein DMF72_06235 [Acidobacteriota bacterium]
MCTITSSFVWPDAPGMVERTALGTFTFGHAVSDIRKAKPTEYNNQRQKDCRFPMFVFETSGAIRFWQPASIMER